VTRDAKTSGEFDGPRAMKCYLSSPASGARAKLESRNYQAQGDYGQFCAPWRRR